MLHRRKTEIVQVNLRLREDLRRRLAKEAEKSGYSFNQELVRRLEQSFSPTVDELLVLAEAVLKGIRAEAEKEGAITGASSLSVGGLRH